MKAPDRKTLWITTAVCLLPLAFSIWAYPQLPEQVAVHWDAVGQPNGYASKAMAAFGLPAFLALIHLIVVFALRYDPRRRNQAPAMQHLSMWLVPVLSCVTIPVTLLIAMGKSVPIQRLVPALVGLLFLLVGNYLPKSRQNYTMGIKLPWTLHDADNWNKTHRMAGRLWMVCGALMMLATGFDFASAPWLVTPIVALLLIMVLVPCLYSFFLYRRMHGDERD
ncbi:MAG TPA: SdpI family protein [Clostridia bacterium]|nr:SdpI family protein [Clostridia bacterium]